jgi:ADP-ribose pyrophosphatase YjhB (NUDIX family)
MSTPNRESVFYEAVASRNIPRIRVAAIIIYEGHLLAQRPADDPTACYALIGGEYEMGDTFESRVRAEIEEETSAKVLTTEYRFVVENRFRYHGNLIQAAEHYLEVTIDRTNVASRESHLSQHWLPLANLMDIDLRPTVVRDVIAHGIHRTVHHLGVTLD